MPLWESNMILADGWQRLTDQEKQASFFFLSLARKFPYFIGFLLIEIYRQIRGRTSKIWRRDGKVENVDEKQRPWSSNGRIDGAKDETS